MQNDHLNDDKNTQLPAVNNPEPSNECSTFVDHARLL